MIEHKDEKVVFSHNGVEYELASHPYEPCLYIKKNGSIAHVLHNAFDAYDLPDIFGAGNTVTAIDGKVFDENAFFKVLAATIDSGRYELDWPYASGLVKEG